MNDVLSSHEILMSVEERYRDIEICVFDSIDSTNTFAKDRA